MASRPGGSGSRTCICSHVPHAGADAIAYCAGRIRYVRARLRGEGRDTGLRTRDRHLYARGRRHRHGARCTQSRGPARPRMQHRLGQYAARPGHIDLEAAARQQTPDTAVRQAGRQRGQQMQLVVLALHEPFRDPGRGTEVAVDLERRMEIEQVGRRPLGCEQVGQQLMGTLALLESCPEVDLPGERPAGARVPALHQGRPGGGEQLGRTGAADLVARMQPVQMGDVPVLPLGGAVVPVLLPLLELSLRADLHHGEPGPRRPDLGAEVGVDTEDFGGTGDGVEQVAQKLVGPRGRVGACLRAPCCPAACRRVLPGVVPARAVPVPAVAGAAPAACARAAAVQEEPAAAGARAAVDAVQIVACQ